MVPVNVFALIASTAPAPNVIVLKPVESESGECSDLIVPIRSLVVAVVLYVLAAGAVTRPH